MVTLVAWREFFLNRVDGSFQIAHKCPNSESIYVVAMYTDTREGYELRFVGNRPFETVGFMDFAKQCQRIVDAMWELGRIEDQ